MPFHASRIIAKLSLSALVEEGKQEGPGQKPRSQFAPTMEWSQIYDLVAFVQVNFFSATDTFKMCHHSYESVSYTVTRTTTHLLEGEAHFDFFSSQAARGFLCERMARQRCSLDQTAHFLIAAWNPGRRWPKQVGTHGRKCLLTTATDHAQASGEKTSLYESRSNPPRAFSKGGSSLETSSSHRPARNLVAVAS